MRRGSADWLQNGSLDKELAHWRSRLQGAPAVLELPTDHPRPAAQSFRGANESLDLDPDVAAALKALSQREGTTLFMTLLAAFKALLSRYTGQEDIVVGSPFTNRQRAEVEGLIGFFVNTVPLRTDLSGDITFHQLLQRVKATALDAYDHRELPFEKLVEELRPERNLATTRCFRYLFAVQNEVSQMEHVAGITLAPAGRRYRHREVRPDLHRSFQRTTDSPPASNTTPIYLRRRRSAA